MMYYRIFKLLVLLVLSYSLAYSQEYVENFTKENTPVANDELRKLRSDILTGKSRDTLIEANMTFKITKPTTATSGDVLYWDGSAWNNFTPNWLPSSTLYSYVTAVSGYGTDVAFDSSQDVVINTQKAITAGKSVLVIASGWANASTANYLTFNLTHNGTLVQQVTANTTAGNASTPWTCSRLITGISGLTHFNITAASIGGTGKCWGNMTVLEF